MFKKGDKIKLRPDYTPAPDSPFNHTDVYTVIENYGNNGFLIWLSVTFGSRIVDGSYFVPVTKSYTGFILSDEE